MVVQNTSGELDPKGPRAKQEIDYGRRGKGYVFGSLQPKTGEVVTHCYPGRTTAAWVNFLHKVETSIPPSCKKVYAIMDNLSTHPRRAPGVAAVPGVRTLAFSH